MGTRGAVGFYKGGEHKVAYNHFDSYPEGLGNDVLNYIHSKTVEGLHAAFERIELVDPESKPTPEQVKKCAEFTNLSVSGQSTDEWYCVLRDAQGDLDAYTKVGAMPDEQDFLKDSLFCEYAYIINLDDNILEVYKGFQESKPKGRYAEFEPKDSVSGSKYYAVGLVKTYPLTDCPEEFNKETIPELYEDDE